MRWMQVLAGAIVLVVFGLFVVWAVLTQPIILTSVAPEPSALVDPTRLRDHVEILSTDFVPRDWEHPENLDRAAEYIRDQLVVAGAEVEFQAYKMDGQTYQNVIGRIGTNDGPAIVVGAHYDAAEGFPGADDNASGVAGLIELAHLVGSNPPPITVEFVAYTLEEPKELGEPGLFRSEFGGSAVHVRSLLENSVTVRAAINFEMIGFYSDDENSQRLPFGFLKPFYPSKGDFIAIIGKVGQGGLVRLIKAAMMSSTPLPVYSLSGPTFIEGVDWSDHANYWNAGYPAVMITDTSFLRNTAYHTPADTSDRLDYMRMAYVLQGVYSALWAISSDGR